MSTNSLLYFFTPRDKKIFFSLFEQAAANLVTMAVALVEIVNSDNPGKRDVLYIKIDKLESVGDDITHRIYLGTGKNYLVPFDREDIHALATAIDNVADNIKGAANQMFLYKIDDFTDDIKKLSEFVLQASDDLEKAVKELKELKKIRTIANSCIRISTIENRADSVFYQAVADLFLYETDAVRIIKYKEIFGSLKTATDMCEDAAKVIETILVKNA